MDPALFATFLNVATIAVIMLAMRLKAKLSELADTLRQPRLVVGSVFANFVFVPVI